MATKTLGPQPGWLVGETIEVFEVDERRQPVGSAVDSVAVASDSTVTFDDLDSGKRYLAVDTNGISVQFAILPDPDEGSGTGLPAGGSTGQVLAKASDDDGDAEWITGGEAPVDADEETKGIVMLSVAPDTDPVACGDNDPRLDAAADLATHVGDTTDAHDASAISFSATGSIAATDAQAAIAEVATDAASALSSHASDTTSIHGIADTSALATATDVSTAVSNHSSDETSVHGIPDTALVPLINVFDSTWPTRPAATVVLWIGGDASDDDPSADMEVGDVWYPASE